LGRSGVARPDGGKIFVRTAGARVCIVDGVDDRSAVDALVRTTTFVRARRALRGISDEDHGTSRKQAEAEFTASAGSQSLGAQGSEIAQVRG